MNYENIVETQQSTPAHFHRDVSGIFSFCGLNSGNNRDIFRLLKSDSLESILADNIHKYSSSYITEYFFLPLRSI